ncbi:hypothetical protein EON65_46180 [archaeon]|nr:MAG: hypothetical protein EON65_46180 [archaeon]
MIFNLKSQTVIALFPPAEQCRKESPWFAGHRECWIANSTWNYDPVLSKAKAVVTSVLKTVPIYYPSNNTTVPVFVYLHVFIQPSSPGGLLIADSILNTMEQSGLLSIASLIYVVAYGEIKHVNLLRTYKNVRIVTQLSKMHYMFEFPTLALLQHHAGELKANGKNAHLLYLHTKGVTQYFDPVRIYIRKIMMEFNIVHHANAMQLLEAGYKAVGILYAPMSNGHHYMGNFFWITPALAIQNPRVLDLVWHWRFGAEKWALSSAMKCEVYTHGVQHEDAERGFYKGEVKLLKGVVREGEVVGPDCMSRM